MTTEERLERLEHELRRVRRRNRRLAAVGAAALLLMGTLVLTGATTPTPDKDRAQNPVFRTLWTRGVAIGDEKPESRIVARVLEGGPQLVLLDRKRGWKATLNVRQSTQWLTLYGGLIGPLMVSRVDKHGPAIVMADEESNGTWQAPPPDDTPEGTEAEDE